MEQSRLSWQVRTAIVVVFAALLAPVVFYPQDWLVYNLIAAIGGNGLPGWICIEASNVIATALLSAALVAIALGLDGLLRRAGRVVVDDVPRCQCGYPLVGLSEARCPECGSKVEVQ